MTLLHIFDMDGTLLDSMGMWEQLCNEYLRSLGLPPDDNIVKITDAMTMNEAVVYLCRKYGLGSPEETMKDIEKYVLGRYQNDLPLFEGAADYLETLRESGVPMVILTNSGHALADAALTRTGVIKYFDAVYTYEDLKVTKSDPESFRMVCERHGVRPCDALVHDDSDYALTAARAAGCRVRVYDRYR